ncbi:putative ribonuclease toxin of YeeF-YezG toxin-antitoxin module [Peribacillus deserti]|uniref:Ribonuclease toxin of YeeF-YezG toxin-antitoxin module n=1 Tax=Peribacillus deserti TaxID=673318 RepID=A0ABS2QFU6_9BACI|nr:T7SS effector LXG polymorphic toxin [Peribacillus deserti]MBM7691679.1 putative ribonuclease toxin of YeeF-YezG toxin-antitoxin module [Peribacillus deserti]
MISKIYEADTLQSAAKERAGQYQQLKDQFDQLKKEFNSIVDNQDFQGKGAEAIKGFYQGQIDVAEAWENLIQHQIAFLEGIPGEAEDADLSGGTVVQVPFLEDELVQADRNADQMVDAQQDALQSIFDSISDLVPLKVFSREAFDNHMDQAEKKRSETVQKVNELDQNLLEQYTLSENQESLVYGLFGALMEATRQGENIVPIYFDSQAYTSSEIYQLRDEVSKQTIDYVNYKKEQQDARIAAEKIEEMENRPWYEKTWDAVANFTGEITGYNDSRRAIEGVDPITGEKLTDAQRITAGAMAAAGFIPILGWAGRALKGGNAIYKTARGASAVSHTVDAFKTGTTMNKLQLTEMGIYGLVAVNGLTESVTAKDMFGNELTDEQRQQSLFTALGIAAVGGAARYVDRVHSSKAFEQTDKLVLTKVKNGIGNVKIPINIRVSQEANEGLKHFHFESKSLSDMLRQSNSGTVVKKGQGNGIQEISNHLNDLLEKSKCSTDDLFLYLNRVEPNLAEKFLIKGEWPEEIQIPKAPSVLNPDGSIKWSEVPNGGYVLNDKGIAIKDEYTPESGEVIDRYGPPNGRYTSPVIDNKPFNYDQRSLPFVEDFSKYHQYKVTGDFNNIEKYVNQCSDPVLVDKVLTYMDSYDLSFDKLKIQKGEIAKGFDSNGGGIQYELPLPVDMLSGLGLLEKIN